MNIVTNFEQVSLMNDSFGNDKGYISNLDFDKLSDQEKLISEESQEITDAIDTKNIIAICDGIGDTLVTTYGLAHLMGVDANIIMSIINFCNMSKVCRDIEEAQESLQSYIDMGIPEDSIVTEFVVASGVWIIRVVKYCIDTSGKEYTKGKFLKNINWVQPEPILASYIESLKHGEEFVLIDHL